MASFHSARILHAVFRKNAKSRKGISRISFRARYFFVYETSPKRRVENTSLAKKMNKKRAEQQYRKRTSHQGEMLEFFHFANPKNFFRAKLVFLEL